MYPSPHAGEEGTVLHYYIVKTEIFGVAHESDEAAPNERMWKGSYASDKHDWLAKLDKDHDE